MLLYHGTTETVARKALVEGLVPRGKRKSNWDVASRADLVYLTTAYAGYFASAACKDSPERWGIVEVDASRLALSNFLPDEDFIEQAGAGGRGTMEQRTRRVRNQLEQYQEHWKLSIEHLGNCAHKGPIPPAAITRVVIFDPAKNRAASWALTDPCISMMNYRLCGAKYRYLTQWVVCRQASLTAEQVLGFPLVAQNEAEIASRLADMAEPYKTNAASEIIFDTPLTNERLFATFDLPEVVSGDPRRTR